MANRPNFDSQTQIIATFDRLPNFIAVCKIGSDNNHVDEKQFNSDEYDQTY